MALSDTTIRSAKAGPGQVVKLSDGGGLQLWVKPNGSKLWNIAYRFANKQRKLSIGAYPAVTLASARSHRAAAKTMLASGIDPGQQKRLDKLTTIANHANSFSALASELADKKRREGKATATLSKLDWLLAMTSADIGSRPIADISAPEILVVLRRVEGNGRLETAKRLRAVIGQVFRYAVATGRANSDPTFALRGAIAVPRVTHRAAITDPKALGDLLRDIADFSGQSTTRAALHLMAILFPRPGELRFATWTEFDWDKGVWTIPASRTKMRREHRVPLPRQALAVLHDLNQITGHNSLVFPSARSVKRPISENTLNAALRRMGYKTGDMTAHGFRAAASTLLNESGRFSADAIERALAHQDADAVRRVYARGEHWQERVTMAQWWADHLDTLRDGAKVIALIRA